MADRVRWLLLTRPGRTVLVAVYVIAAVISVVTYTVTHGIGYGLGQVVLFVFALAWIPWCMRRARDRSTKAST